MGIGLSRVHLEPLLEPEPGGWFRGQSSVRQADGINTLSERLAFLTVFPFIHCTKVPVRE